MRGGAPATAYVQLAASMTIVGLCVTLGKIAVEHMPIVALAGVRCAAAAIALWPLALRERPQATMARSDRTDLFWQAFFGVFAFTLLMLGGVRLTGAAEAGLIAATMPLAILVLALPLLGERLTGRAILAALTATLGIAVVTLAGGSGEGRLAGNVLVALAVIAEALYTLFAKRLSTRIAPATMAVRLNLVALALFAPFLVMQPWGALLRDVPEHIWVVGVIYGVGTSGVALVLWYRGTRAVQGGAAGLFTVFLPVGAILSAALLLGEPVGARHVVGGAIIAAALLVGLGPWRARLGIRR